MKAYWGSGGTAPCIPDLGTRCRWVVSFTPRERAPGTWLAVYVLKYKHTIMPNHFNQDCHFTRKLNTFYLVKYSQN